MKEAIQGAGGEMPVEELLDQMKRVGYLREPLRGRLALLDVEVVDGKARLKGW